MTILSHLTILLVFMGVMLMGLLLRWLPHRMAAGGLGVDHWYWKLYLETYWRERRFPPELPQYLLDEAQWYPPLFIMLVARLPRIVFERYSHMVGLMVDLLRLALCMALVGWLSNGNVLAVGIAGMIYATTPIMVSYNVQLNPRGLGALILDIQVLLLMLLHQGGPWWLWAAACLLGALVLLTHKMTTQLMLFLSLTGTILTGDWRIAAVIPVSMLTAWLISGGFYWKVLLAHWDIVTFWYRNWPWLMAHPVKDSPIYGEPGHLAPGLFYQPGLKGQLRHVQYFFAYNPWAWVCLPLPLLMPNQGTLNTNALFGWHCATLLFGILTIVIPQLRCIGAGYLYVYNTALPAALLWCSVVVIPYRQPLTTTLLVLGLLTAMAAIAMFYRNVINSRTLKADEDFEQLIDWLTDAERGTVMCLPMVWYDLIAYRTGQPVLYGGHGYGLKLIEPILPRLLVPLAHLASTYKIRYLVAMENYLNDSFMNDLRYTDILKFGPYRIYCLIPYDSSDCIQVSDKVYT